MSDAGPAPQGDQARAAPPPPPKPVPPPKPARESNGNGDTPAEAAAEPEKSQPKPPAVPPKPAHLTNKTPPGSSIEQPQVKGDGAAWRAKKLGDYNLKSVIKLQSLIRRHLHVVRWRKLAKMIAKRTNVAKEILSTEKTYVGNLRILVSGFLTPLRANAKSETPLLTEENLKAIFSDIEVILGYHTVFEKELDKRLQQWTQNTKLGDLFLKIASFLKTYNQYIQHYKKALLLLADLNKNPEFAAMMEKLRFQPQCAGKGIKDYLIMPVQRIPRYSMLLQDMLKNTWPDHADYASLTQALKVVLELATYVEEQQGENVNVSKVLEIQNTLTGKITEGLNLVQPSRRYVREAAMQRLEKDGSTKPVYAFLFNDLVIWTKPAKAGQYEVTKLDTLITLIVKDAQMGQLDPATHPKAFTVVTPQGSSTVVCASAEEKKLWQTDIRKHIIESNDKYNAVKKTTAAPKDQAGNAPKETLDDILTFQKVSPAAVTQKKEEGFAASLLSGLGSVLSRGSGGGTNRPGTPARGEGEEEERTRSGSVRSSSPRSVRNVAKSPRTIELRTSDSQLKLNAASGSSKKDAPPSLSITPAAAPPPKLSARSLSLAQSLPRESKESPKAGTERRHSVSDDVSPMQSPKGPPLAALDDRSSGSSPRTKKEKKERTKKSTLDPTTSLAGKSSKKEEKREEAKVPAYVTLRGARTGSTEELPPPAPAPAAAAATKEEKKEEKKEAKKEEKKEAPDATVATEDDEQTQARLARLKDENEEVARRLKKMQEKLASAEK